MVWWGSRAAKCLVVGGKVVKLALKLLPSSPENLAHNYQAIARPSSNNLGFSSDHVLLLLFKQHLWDFNFLSHHNCQSYSSTEPPPLCISPASPPHNLFLLLFLLITLTLPDVPSCWTCLSPWYSGWHHALHSTCTSFLYVFRPPLCLLFLLLLLNWMKCKWRWGWQPCRVKQYKEVYCVRREG